MDEQFYGDNFEYSYGNFYFADVFRWPSTDIDKLTATAVSATCAILEDILSLVCSVFCYPWPKCG